MTYTEWSNKKYTRYFTSIGKFISTFQCGISEGISYHLFEILTDYWKIGKSRLSKAELLQNDLSFSNSTISYNKTVYGVFKKSFFDNYIHFLLKKAAR